RSGQHDKKIAVVIQHHPDCRAIRIRKNYRSVYDERLTLVDLRHLAAPLAEALAKMSFEILVIDELAAGGLRRNRTCNVVLGRAKPAGRDDDIGTLQRIAARF